MHRLVIGLLVVCLTTTLNVFISWSIAERVAARSVTVGAVRASMQEEQAGVADLIRARRIELVDEAGSTRVRLASPLPNPVVGGVEFERTNPAHGLQLISAQGSELGGIGVLDMPGGQVRLFALDYDTAEAAGFHVFNGESRFIVAAPPAADAEVGESGPMIATLGMGFGDESNGLTLYDSQSRPRLVLTIDGDTPRIRVLDADGQIVRDLLNP